MILSNTLRAQYKHDASAMRYKRKTLFVALELADVAVEEEEEEETGEGGGGGVRYLSRHLLLLLLGWDNCGGAGGRKSAIRKLDKKERRESVIEHRPEVEQAAVLGNECEQEYLACRCAVAQRNGDDGRQREK